MHIVSRFACLLLLVIIQTMVIHVRSDTFYDMIAEVSESGQDTKSCFNRGYSCKTLVYVLRFLTGYNFLSVLINVTYNQTIIDMYNINIPTIKILHITGNEGVYINFPNPESSLQIVHRHTYAWAWIDLGFASQSFGIDCENPAVTHSGALSRTSISVSVINCTLASVTWKVEDVTNFIIDNTEFTSTIKNFALLYVTQEKFKLNV